MKMKYVFGPVSSRRLGQSLGVDPLPMKTCNWSCAYCQLGRTVPLTSTRKDYFPPEEILAEVREVLSGSDRPHIDWISLVGSGEPLLVASLGHLIRGIRAVSPIPIALITNGSLFFLPEVRRDVLDVQAVLPSVDAGSAEVYRRINRPHPQATFERHIEGLIELRKEFSGKIWPEVMLVKGINDTEQALQDIANVLKRIRPDQIHISTPVRPPAEDWVRSPDEAALRRAADILGEIACVIPPAEATADLTDRGDIQETLINMISRHPVADVELRKVLGHRGQAEAEDALAALKAGGKVKVVERNGQMYWCSAISHFPAGKGGGDISGKG